jgi:hypothetical protein
MPVQPGTQTTLSEAAMQSELHDIFGKDETISPRKIREDEEQEDEEQSQTTTTDDSNETEYEQPTSSTALVLYSPPSSPTAADMTIDLSSLEHASSAITPPLLIVNESLLQLFQSNILKASQNSVSACTSPVTPSLRLCKLLLPCKQV